jgi:hypothetical protein
MMIRTYRELIALPTFKERFEYLKLTGAVGKATFGYDRYLNQNFYRSNEWRTLRNEIITRDCGCDLGLTGYDIRGRIIIHHMNPLRPNDIINSTDFLLNPEYLICVSRTTHNAIHYGDESLIAPMDLVERKQNDTCPWRKQL